MITEMITSGQRKQLIRVLEDGVDVLNLTKAQADEILKVGNLVQADLKASLNKHSIAVNFFSLAVVEFEITVPTDYNHDTQIDQFAEKVKKLETTHCYDDALTSKNFAKATNKLVPGKTYKVKIFPILKKVTSGDCISFLAKQNAILVGGQGATLAQDLKGDQFPKGKWMISFDQKDALWKDSGGHYRVPHVHARSDGAFEFHLGYLELGWHDDDRLLCFCDK